MDMPTPFKRMTFEEAMNRFGIDKPDTRFGMELVDFTDDFAASTFKVFSGAIDNGGVVKALNAKGIRRASRRADRRDDGIREELRRERAGVHQSGRTANGNRPS